MKQSIKMAVLFFLLGTSWMAQAQRVVGYMPYWAGDANLIQYTKLTHINYAFALPNADGSIKPISDVAKLQTIVSRAHAAGAKVLIAIGGYTDNGEMLDSRFEQLAGNATTRARFVSAAMGLVSTYNLDGIDMDWEYPDPGQSSNNYDLLMTDLSNQLKPQGKLLSAAVTGYYNGGGISALALSKMDYVNIMAYDENDFQHSTFEYALTTLNYWAGRGVAKSKLNLGVPFYGRQNGEVSYATLLSRGADPNADVFGSIGYNGLVTMRRKAQYVKDQGYGGIMIWELSEDVTNANSLVSAIYGVLGGTTPPPVNQAPAVTLTSPAGGASASAPATFTLTATATDTDGSVARVEFYNGATLLFSDNAAPYTYAWTGVAAGSYTLTAKAVDNLGLSSTSASRGVTVTTTTPTNQIPVVSLTSPTNGTSALAPASFNLTASATDADGSIVKVEFYNGSALLFTDNTAPYAYTWTNVAAGSYTLTARATDNAGATTTSTASVVTATTSTSGNQAPSVRITAPVNNGTYNSPAAVTIMVDASDVDGSISKVDFYNGATLIGTDNTSPYYIVWSNVGGGSYPVTAVATDNGGLTKTSAVVNVVVYGTVITPPSNQLPTVSLTAPANGTSVIAPGTFNLTATASDADGSISKVEFYNGATLLFTDNTAPYAFSWSNVAAGSYALTAKATDNLGASTTTTATTVTVTTAAPVNQAPLVSLTSPTNGTTSTAPGSFNLTASASDADGSIARVEFYSGSTLLFTDYTAPYAYSWTNVAVGSYTLTAKAIDNLGLTATSTAVSVSAIAPGGACTVPAWDATIAYVGGNIVQYGGIKYKANWWTRGDRPDMNNGVFGTGMVWTSQGGCNAREGYNNNLEAENTVQTITLAPNPVEQAGLVTLNLIEDDQVELYIIDVNGRIISTLYSGVASYGTHTFALNSTTLAPGIYQVMMKGEKGNVNVNFIKN